MNYFKLWIGDYQRDTAHLSVVEHGAYLLMLQHYYAREKPLPVGRALHRLLRAEDKAARDAIDAVAAQFWTQTPEGLVNARADAEISKAAAQAESNRVVALAREARRKVARTQHKPSTNAAQTEHESCTNRGTKSEPTHSHSHSHSQTEERSLTPVGHRERAPVREDLPEPPDQPPTIPTMAGAVCVAMRAAGLGSVNPAHPKLLSLLQAGAPIGAFVGAAQDAAARGKGFAYSLAIVEGQLAEARAAIARPGAPPRMSATERAAEAVAALTGKRDRTTDRRTIDVESHPLG